MRYDLSPDLRVTRPPFLRERGNAPKGGSALYDMC